jgi:RHS repeat-associated protein
MPQYAWQAQPGLHSLPGESAIVIMGSRPYHPALGQFLAIDSDPGNGNNLYSYTSGDPINRNDLSGNAEGLGTLGQWVGVAGIVAAAFGPVGLLIGAVAGVASVGLQVAGAVSSGQATTGDWVSIGLSALVTVMGAVTSIRAIRNINFIAKYKRAAVEQAGSKLTWKTKAVRAGCYLSWGCSRAMGMGGIGKFRATLESQDPRTYQRALKREKWAFGLGVSGS